MATTNDGWPPFRIVFGGKKKVLEEEETRMKMEKCVNAAHLERVTFDLHLESAKIKTLNETVQFWFLPLYESFIRGEEEAVGEEDEGDDVRAAVLEEAWAAAMPSRNNELQVTVVAAIIIIMVIILTHLNTEPRPSQRKY